MGFAPPGIILYKDKLMFALFPLFLIILKGPVSRYFYLWFFMNLIHLRVLNFATKIISKIMTEQRH